VLDLGLLGKTLANSENDRGRTIFAVANVLAVTALDIMAAKQLSRQPETVANEKMDRGIVRTKRSVTVNCPWKRRTSCGTTSRTCRGSCGTSSR
jgi:hypothetical protein